MEGRTGVGRGKDSKVPTGNFSAQLDNAQHGQPSVMCETSPGKKKKSRPSITDIPGISHEINKEISLLIFTFADVMGERAKLDLSRVTELEDILKEAKGLECHLREKKERLRQSLALISDKLQ